MRDELTRVREWADAKLATGEEPPWAWYQYMKLREALDGVIAGMDAVSPTASLQQSGPHQGRHLRLVVSMCPQDTVPPHQSELNVPLPM